MKRRDRQHIPSRICTRAHNHLSFLRESKKRLFFSGDVGFEKRLEDCTWEFAAYVFAFGVAVDGLLDVCA